MNRDLFRFSLVIGLTLLPILGFAESNSKNMASPDLPRAVVDLVRAKYPAAEVVSATPCKLGTAGLEGYGLVYLTKKTATLTPGDVRPAIVVRVAGHYELIEIDPKIDVPGVGNVPSFINDFVSEGKLKGKIEVKCTNPEKDNDIHEDRGKYLIHDEPLLSHNHLCYAADFVYNSWTCYIYDDQSKTIRNSFVQLLAD
jgi:hypothetical protein